MPKEEFALNAERMLESGGFECLDARAYTIDHFGRYSRVAGKSVRE